MVRPLKLRMSKAEANLFSAFVGRSKGYFEFGSGGSTVYAASVVQGPLYSIDSAQDWTDKVKEALEPSEFTRVVRSVDIGPTGAWGKPVSDEDRHLFPSYHEAVRTVDPKEIDLCFVDGRFRVACFLQALNFLSRDTIFGMHDYRTRNKYHVVERFARPIAEAENITFFLPRASIDSAELLDSIEKYRYTSR